MFFLVTRFFEPTVLILLMVSTRGFLHCVVEFGKFFMVLEIHICYKKYVSNHVFSKISRFCLGAHFLTKLHSLLSHEVRTLRDDHAFDFSIILFLAYLFYPGIICFFKQTLITWKRRSVRDAVALLKPAENLSVALNF